jgi:hypothetical protein
VFALKGIISSSPLQAAGLSNGVKAEIIELYNINAEDGKIRKLFFKILEPFSFPIVFLSENEKSSKGGNRNGLDQQSIFIVYLRTVNTHCLWCPGATHGRNEQDTLSLLFY